MFLEILHVFFFWDRLHLSWSARMPLSPLLRQECYPGVTGWQNPGQIEWPAGRLAQSRQLRHRRGSCGTGAATGLRETSICRIEKSPFVKQCAIRETLPRSGNGSARLRQVKSPGSTRCNRAGSKRAPHPGTGLKAKAGPQEPDGSRPSRRQRGLASPAGPARA